MSAPPRRAVLGSALLALAAADLGARLLTPREPVPDPAEVDLRAYFTEEEMARGARYARPQFALALAGGAVRFGLLACLIGRAGGSAAPETWLVRLRGRLGRRRAHAHAAPVAAARAAVAAAALAAAETAVGLPVSAVARRRSLAVGLSTQSWAAWGSDVVKSLGIEAVFAAAGGALVAEVGRRRPDGWWAPAAVGSILVGTVLGALAPVLLDPIFNDFTPLPDGALREDVLALAAAAGVRVGEVYSVDASRRTTAANAYVTGLGPTKRVVLFDTLLDRYSAEEIRTVVAHEFAHVLHRDVPRSVLYGALVAVPASRAVQRLAETLHPQPTSAAGLPALTLAAALVTGPVGVLGSRLSRAVERRADAFAFRLAQAPEAFVSFERSISLQNVADVDPPSWMVALASHPPTAERIGAALAAADADGRPTEADRPRTRGGS